jgi:ribosomal protein S18 acetylase RimI-like enzyme
LSRFSLEPLQQADDVHWCARLMSSSDPWLTLGRDYAACRAALEDASRERSLIVSGGQRSGLLIINMNVGPLLGYIQAICLAPEMRATGLGSEVIDAAEQRIFRDSPNVFLCVSSFNDGARRLYERLGYQLIGEIENFFVEGQGELLMRKSRGTWRNFLQAGR